MAENKKAPPPRPQPPKPITSSTSSGSFYQTNGENIQGARRTMIVWDSVDSKPRK
jgi:hypothetical protein|nr:MAG TPA: hypothetical protein [Caudoviricetes sp.]